MPDESRDPSLTNDYNEISEIAKEAAQTIHEVTTQATSRGIELAVERFLLQHPELDSEWTDRVTRLMRIRCHKELADLNAEASEAWTRTRAT